VSGGERGDLDMRDEFVRVAVNRVPADSTQDCEVRRHRPRVALHARPVFGRVQAAEIGGRRADGRGRLPATVGHGSPTAGDGPVGSGPRTTGLTASSAGSAARPASLLGEAVSDGHRNDGRF